MSDVSAPVHVGLHPVLVTGGSGFIGCNLADRLAREGRHVIVLDSLKRPGTERNASWLLSRHPERVSMIRGDVRDEAAVREAVRDASAVFHFAAQVAVTTSLVEPRDDFSVNVGGTFGILEALRRRKKLSPFIFASTNKVYGDLADLSLELEDTGYRPLDPEVAAHGVAEERPLDFHTPYGCSKGAADQYVLDYARSFGLPTALLRMSCIYGPRQMGTEDQGWVAHFLLCALRDEPIVVYGDGHQVRDILFVDDAVDAYLALWRDIHQLSGRAYNLGGGPANAISLRTLIGFIESELDRRIRTVHQDWRAGDQRYYVSDTRRAQRELGLARPRPWREGVSQLLEWLRRKNEQTPFQSRQPAEAFG
jgi:CDP-paratose 2-epimerase